MGIWYLVILIAAFLIGIPVAISMGGSAAILMICLLYTSDAADE